MTTGTGTADAAETGAGRAAGTLFVSDLDGTLLNTAGRLGERSAEALTALIADRGLRFTVATARSYDTARVALAGLPLALPMVVYSGAMAVEPDSGARLWWVPLDAAVAAAVVDTARGFGVPSLVFWMRGDEDRISWTGENDGVRAFLAARPGDRRLLAGGDWAGLAPAGVFFISITGEAARIRAIESAIRGAPWATRCAVVVAPDDDGSGRLVLDLTAAAATKASGVRRVAGSLGLDRVVAFGDGPNDLPLFAVADEAYAVGNASAEVRAAATGVIGTNDDDGVAAWLEEHARA